MKWCVGRKRRRCRWTTGIIILNSVIAVLNDKMYPSSIHSRSYSYFESIRKMLQFLLVYYSREFDRVFWISRLVVILNIWWRISSNAPWWCGNNLLAEVERKCMIEESRYYNESRQRRWIKECPMRRSWFDLRICNSWRWDNHNTVTWRIITFGYNV